MPGALGPEGISPFLANPRMTSAGSIFANRHPFIRIPPSYPGQNGWPGLTTPVAAGRSEHSPWRATKLHVRINRVLEGFGGCPILPGGV